MTGEMRNQAGRTEGTVGAERAVGRISYRGRGAGLRIAGSASLFAACLFLVTACSQEEKVVNGSVQNLPAEEGSGEEIGPANMAGGGDNADDGQAVDGTGTDGGETAADSGKGYTFVYQGVTVEIDADAAPILDQLGEPVSYFEAASCAFDGLDKMYTYHGFELDTYPDGDKDYVSGVILKDDSVLTAEGIGIGDTREELEQAYPGEGAGAGQEENGMLVYEKDGMKLCFILQEDEIISIEYRSTVLED